MTTVNDRIRARVDAVADSVDAELEPSPSRPQTLGGVEAWLNRAIVDARDYMGGMGLKGTPSHAIVALADDRARLVEALEQEKRKNDLLAGHLDQVAEHVIDQSDELRTLQSTAARQQEELDEKIRIAFMSGWNDGRVSECPFSQVDRVRAADFGTFLEETQSPSSGA